MQANLIEIKGAWRRIADAANVTVNKEDGDKEPSSAWKLKLLRSEHSPIRKRIFVIRWKELKSWVSVHLVRHKFGIEHFVRTQRSDRTGIDRNKLPQDSLVEHEIEVNAQALITISRKRLCRLASPETREAWTAALESIRYQDPEVYACCVPDCVYRGACFEMKCCGFSESAAFTNARSKYVGPNAQKQALPINLALTEREREERMKFGNPTEAGVE